MALSVSPNFDRRYILRNSKYKGKWELEEIAGATAFPLNRGSVFCIEIFATGKEFLVSTRVGSGRYLRNLAPFQQYTCPQIALNSVHYCSFQYRTSLSAINSLGICGDVGLGRVTIKNEDSEYPHPWVCECGSKVENFYTLDGVIGCDTGNAVVIACIEYSRMSLLHLDHLDNLFFVLENTSNLRPV